MTPAASGSGPDHPYSHHAGSAAARDVAARVVSHDALLQPSPSRRQASREQAPEELEGSPERRFRAFELARASSAASRKGPARPLSDRWHTDIAPPPPSTTSAAWAAASALGADQPPPPPTLTSRRGGPLRASFEIHADVAPPYPYSQPQRPQQPELRPFDVEGARRAREQRRAQLDASVARARTIARAKWEAERPIVLAELKHNRPSRPKVGEEALQWAKERARSWWERGNGSPQRQRQPEREWRVPPRSPAAAQAAAAAATATAIAGGPHVGDERMLRGGAGVDGSVSARVPSGPPSEASQHPTSHSDAAMDAMRAELESTQELVRRMEQRLLQSEMRRLHPSGTMAPGTAAAGDVPAPAMTGGTGTWSSSPSSTPQHATPVMAATAHRVDGARSSPPPPPPSSSTTSPPPLSQPQRPVWGISVATDGAIASASTSTSTSTIQEGAAAPLGVPLVPTPRTRSNDGATAKESSLLPPTRAAAATAAATATATATATAATCDDAVDTASPGRLGARSARRKVDVPPP
eukprot:COSAG01_NODE_208_length_21996_cov_31.972097_9_plen_527_part_00